MALDHGDIYRLLDLLSEELGAARVTGELYLVGGAVMSLVYEVRPSTRDLDAYFRPAAEIREAARRIAVRADVPADWLNDAVKGYLGQHGDFKAFLELSNLRVMIASPEYLLAMKCLAMRLGAEFHDEADIRYLLRYLNIDDYQSALEIIARYYPLDEVPQKTLYALEEILGDSA